MFKRFGIIMCAGFIVASFTPFLFAQSDIEIDLLKYWSPADNVTAAKKNMENAVNPLLDLFGFTAGGGLYNTADVHGVLGFDVGIKLTGMMVGDEQKPTLVGMPSGLQNGPLGNESVVPVPVLQASVGLVGNLEVIGRYFTFPIGKENSANGNVTLLGIGAKYGLIQVFGLPKVAVVGAYHRLTVPEDFHFEGVNNMSLALVASYSFPALATIYGGAGIDYSSLTVKLPDPYPQLDAFTKQNFRGNVGMKFTPIPLVPLFVNIDYNFGVVKGLSAGLGISVR
ncbi:hypothetical protein JW960_23635 [candidate division KSB1 bacterium]|nr:hypothetical protein [candidate division KSB1 bacterium]